MLSSLLIIFKDLLHDWVRTFINIIGLSVAVVSYLLLSGLAAGMEDFINQPRYSPNLMIIEKGVMDPGDSRINQQVTNLVEQYFPDEIKRISPLIFKHMLIDDHVVQVRATPAQDWVPVYSLTLAAGRWPGDGTELLAGEGAIEAYHWQIGSLLRIYGSDFTIVGIVRSPGTKFAAVWMTLEQAKKLFFQADEYNFLVAQVTAGIDADLVRNRLLSNPDLASQCNIFFEDSFARRNGEGAVDIRNILQIVSLVSLLAVTLGSFSASLLSLTERSHEVGILRAVGFNHLTLRNILILRTLVQTLLAYALSLLIIAVYLSRTPQEENMVILGAPFSMEITLTITLMGLVLVMLFSLLGVLFSSRQLMHVIVADALRD
jgi:ABC-type antimicrobial peptide transport system permease subunit